MPHGDDACKAICPTTPHVLLLSLLVAPRSRSNYSKLKKELIKKFGKKAVNKNGTALSKAFHVLKSGQGKPAEVVPQSGLSPGVQLAARASMQRQGSGRNVSAADAAAVAADLNGI